MAFLAASEIARELAAGTVHLGVTGEDLVRETVADADARIALLARLGFGHADVVVAVPELWIDVWTMEDLDDVAAGFRARHGRRMRIATKYWNLTQGFFAAHGIALYRVVESLGATEGAPAAGTADLIVDITTTGATLAANHLKILEDGVILKSEAQPRRFARRGMGPGCEDFGGKSHESAHRRRHADCSARAAQRYRRSLKGRGATNKKQQRCPKFNRRTPEVLGVRNMFSSQRILSTSTLKRFDATDGEKSDEVQGAHNSQRRHRGTCRD